LCHLLGSHITNITPAAGTGVRKSGRKKRKKWTGATHITLNPLSLCTGGTSESSHHQLNHETSFLLSSSPSTDVVAGSPRVAGSPLVNLGNHANIALGNCLETEVADKDEDDFLQQVLQVCNQGVDTNSPDSISNCSTNNNTFNINLNNNNNNINNNNSNNSSDNNTDNNINNGTSVVNNNNVELFDFHLQDGEHMVLSWKAARYLDRLYVNIPGGLLPAGSRECFVSLLEYAEEILNVGTMYLCMNKDRTDRANLLRIFMFLGFEIVRPGACPFVPRSEKFLFMGYSFD